APGRPRASQKARDSHDPQDRDPGPGVIKLGPVQLAGDQAMRADCRHRADCGASQHQGHSAPADQQGDRPPAGADRDPDSDLAPLVGVCCALKYMVGRFSRSSALLLMPPTTPATVNMPQGILSRWPMGSRPAKNCRANVSSIRATGSDPGRSWVAKYLPRSNG